MKRNKITITYFFGFFTSVRTVHTIHQGPRQDFEYKFLKFNKKIFCNLCSSKSTSATAPVAPVLTRALQYMYPWKLFYNLYFPLGLLKNKCICGRRECFCVQQISSREARRVLTIVIDAHCSCSAHQRTSKKLFLVELPK